MRQTTRTEWAVVAVIAVLPLLLSIKFLRDAWQYASGEQWDEAARWFLIGTIPWILVGVILVRARLKYGRWVARRAWWLCKKCGYDLRRTPGTEKVCPECGTVNDRPW